MTGVVELLALVGILFERTSSSHRSAVAFLEELAEKTGDPLVRKKLVTYANQLKQKWNQAEPGGIHHALRARTRGFQVRCHRVDVKAKF